MYDHYREDANQAQVGETLAIHGEDHIEEDSESENPDDDKYSRRSEFESDMKVLNKEVAQRNSSE